MSGTNRTGRAVVIGGGIAGLTAAFDLQRAGWTVEVREATDRWGGKIASSPVGDRLVDAGPDTFLARAEAGYRLCADLGLTDELTSPVSAVPAYLVRSGALHPLPPRSVLGVPTDLDALESSGLISPEGVAHARANLYAAVGGGSDDGDPSVGEVCRAQLGDEITDRLVDPLLGGINASDIDRLSLRAGAPLLAQALDAAPSLIEGLQQLRPATGPAFGSGDDRPVFYGLPGGIARIIDALVDALANGDGPPAKLHLDSPVSSLDEVGPADAIVVATPAFAAAELVASVSPEAAEGLAGIDYASVAQVALELPVEGVARDLDASGILFPRVEGTTLTACTWFSTKWAHYRRPGTVLLRLTSGRFGDDRPFQLDDDALIETLVAELSAVVPVTGQPSAIRVQRWPQSFPQYTPGHGERVAAIQAALADAAPHVHLVGAAYTGIGIPACIDSGRGAAAAIIDGGGAGC